MLEFKEKLTETVNSLPSGEIVTDEGIKKITKITDSYADRFSDEQKDIIKTINDTVVINAESIPEEIKKFKENKKYPLGTNPKFPARNVVILLSRYSPHTEGSTVLLDFCEACREKLEEYVEDPDKIMTGDGEPEDANAVLQSMRRFEKAYTSAVEQMKQFAVQAKKL